MNKQNVEIWSGDTRTLTFTARDYSNDVINLTDATITWRVGFPGRTSVIQKTGAIVSAAAGTFTVSLVNGDTNNLRQRDYQHMAEITQNGGIKTGVRGRFRVLGVIQPYQGS